MHSAVTNYRIAQFGQHHTENIQPTIVAAIETESEIKRITFLSKLSTSGVLETQDHREEC